MIELTNTTEQTIQPGAAIIFNTVQFQKGSCCHRKNSPSAKLNRRGDFLISFSANVGSPTETTAVELIIEAGGEPLPETIMISTSAAAGDINNVAKQTIVHNCCCDYDRITVVNNGTAAVNVDAYPVLIITEV